MMHSTDKSTINNLFSSISSESEIRDIIKGYTECQDFVPDSDQPQDRDIDNLVLFLKKFINIPNFISHIDLDDIGMLSVNCKKAGSDVSINFFNGAVSYSIINDKDVLESTGKITNGKIPKILAGNIMASKGDPRQELRSYD